jgi:hypothetical protein
MRVVAHHSKNYNWVPVPADVTVTQPDIDAGLVKRNISGGWSMRVTETRDGHTTFTIAESDIIGQIVFEKCRPTGGRTLTRQQAVAFFIHEMQLQHHCQRVWLTGFEVDDDGPDAELCKAVLAEHVKAGNITEADADAHMAAYAESATADDHAAHLQAFFKVKAKA